MAIDFTAELERRRKYREALIHEDEKDQRKNPMKQACEVSPSANIVIAGLQTIQGFTGVTDSRILLHNQTDPKENGIWYMRTDAWVRAFDADTSASLEDTVVTVKRGDYADKIFMQITDDIELGVSDIIFQDVTSTGGGGGGLTLGETASTAYRGDRGKTAYLHSQIVTGNPHGTNKSDIGLGNVENTADADKPISSATQSALDNKQNSINGNSKSLLWLNQAGVATTVNEFVIDETTKGLAVNTPVVPAGTTNYKTLHNLFAAYNPTVSDSKENWRHFILEAYIGNDDSGNKLGDDTNGSLEIFSAAINSMNKSNVGQARSVSAYGSFGNATDPMHIRSYAAYGGNVQFRNNTDIGNIGVFEYGVTVESGASVGDVRGFNITGNIDEITLGLNGYSIGLNIPQGNYANVFSCFNQYGNMSGGINVFSDFSSLTGASNNGYMSFAAQPNLTEVQNYQGINISPTVDMCDYANGVNVNMDNVTVFAGNKGSVTIQDLFFETVNNTGDPFTVEFVDDATAGSESVTNSNADITVHIESGVSTATQIKAAWDAVPLLVANVSATITGTAGNTQTAVSPQSFTGGQYPGQKYAAQFKGNVKIDGNFEFSGALSIGLLSSFGQKALHSGAGQPDSAHTLISAITAPASSTFTGADMIGVNTAALIQIGDNASITTSFLGVAALGLPAVVTMGTGATVDKISGALFAISLDSTATGGTIDTVDLCRAVALPNGVTTVNKLHAYSFDFPVSPVGTEIWGLYLAPDSPNWLAGSLKIGGAAGITDKPTGTNKFQMEGGDFALAANVKTGFYGTTPVVQPTSSGAATATGSYTSTEQTMLQEVYNAVRALGLMS